MRLTPPTASEVRMLPTLRTYRMSEEYIDFNGHVNVAAFFDIAIHAVGDRSEECGFGISQIPTDGLSTFTAEQHLTYFSELLVGQEVTTHVRLLGRSARALHSQAYLVDVDNDRVSFVLEMLVVETDIVTRRAVPFPEPVRRLLDEGIAADARLPWAAPLTQGISLSSPAHMGVDLGGASR
jgi:acyl-CoA thioester hydrolase